MAERALDRVAALAWKDALELLRDRRSLALMVVSAFLFPLLGVLVTGLQRQQAAVVAVVLCDHGEAAEKLAGLITDALEGAPGLRVVVVNASGCRAPEGAVLAVAVPPGFSVNASSLGKPVIIKLYKVIGSPAADTAEAYVNAALQRFSQSLARERVERLAKLAGVHVDPDVVLSPLRLVSEEVTPSGAQASPIEAARARAARFLAFAVFFVLNPAAIAVADSISRERESGTGELLAVTPLRGWEFVAGKAIGGTVAALVAGGVDAVAALAYGFATGFQGADAGLIAVHVVETMLAIVVTASLTILATLLVPGQRAATLITSTITGLAMMIFFSVLFIDIKSLPAGIKALLYLVPYTHTALAIESYALGDVAAALLHTLVLAVLSVAALAAAVKAYRPDRLVKRS